MSVSTKMGSSLIILWDFRLAVEDPVGLNFFFSVVFFKL